MSELQRVSDGQQVFVCSLIVAKTGKRFTRFCPPSAATAVGFKFRLNAKPSVIVSSYDVSVYDNMEECIDMFKERASIVFRELDEHVNKINNIRSRVQEALINSY